MFHAKKATQTKADQVTRTAENFLQLACLAPCAHPQHLHLLAAAGGRNQFRLAQAEKKQQKNNNFLLGPETTFGN